MTADIVWFAIGLMGIGGCVFRFVADCQAQRRSVRMLATGATRLIDGERFPQALPDFEAP
jgi:hypothetical protein